MGGMFETLATPWLVVIFIASSAAVWVAGIQLAKATDILASRWGMGEALGGLVVLAIVTNLPEIAIVSSGAIRGDFTLAVGNILGGIAVQTVVLVIIDAFGVGKEAPLTFRAASPSLMLEAALVIAVLGLVIIGSQLPSSLIICRVTPQAVLIAVCWVVGAWLIGRSRSSLPWYVKESAAEDEVTAREASKTENATDIARSGKSTIRPAIIFCIGAIVTLACGVLLELTGDKIAERAGMDGVLFGATILAAATALPEVSTGLASVKLKDYQMAVSDIFGGNAFLPVLFLLATLLSGKAVLPHAQRSDIYLTGLGMLLTSVYLAGMIFRSRRQVARMGLDSLVVLILYGLGIAGLWVITPKE